MPGGTAGELGAQGQDAGQVALEGSRPGPGEFEHIRIVLVGHDARPRRERRRQAEEAELLAGIENDVSRQLREIVAQLDTPEEDAGLEFPPPILDLGYARLDPAEPQRPRGRLSAEGQRHPIPGTTA